MIKVGDMVHFEATDVIRTVKYCNFSSCIMKLQYLKCILPRIFFSKIKVEKTQLSHEIYQFGTQWKYVLGLLQILEIFGDLQYKFLAICLLLEDLITKE